MNKFISLVILMCSTFLFFCCTKKEIGPQFSGSTNGNAFYFDVLIGCEGNFGTSNGSITAYSSTSDSLSNYYFQQQNNYPLGDVVQSMSLIDGDLFVVVNNSGKVEVVDSADLSLKYSITDLTSPREVIKVTDSVVYISDLYSNAISVFDKFNHSLLTTIPVSGWTESMVMFNSTVFVAAPSKNLVYTIDATTHQLIDSISVGSYPYDLLIDKNNKLWVLCGGEYNMNNGTLEKINPISLTNELIIELNASASSLCADVNAANIFWISNGVNTLDVDISTPSLIIPTGNALIYGLGVHPSLDHIYVTDAIDYVQSGKLMIYTMDGTFIKEKNTGIIPQSILFK